ncbi:hypothetical protein ZIOFF_071499 [Zingiber officinale]|uniref:Plus3 domain-containing protein n=1 Tax=Zingiber officinale TaxID=94328 RepID=A0A8J5BEC1_ZINOF|nr:hypothetical protein ZIOFF_071499 [Zingiber officinale]
MYLRRNLMEGLIDDDEFEEKAIGSFVRIRISGLGQWQDMYRLVQVIGRLYLLLSIDSWRQDLQFEGVKIHEVGRPFPPLRRPFIVSGQLAPLRQPSIFPLRGQWEEKASK